jgi:hypothetical protein
MSMHSLPIAYGLELFEDSFCNLLSGRLTPNIRGQVSPLVQYRIDSRVDLGGLFHVSEGREEEGS